MGRQLSGPKSVLIWFGGICVLIYFIPTPTLDNFEALMGRQLSGPSVFWGFREGC